MTARVLAPLLAAALLAGCGGGNGADSGGGSERPEAGEHKTPPEDLGAPAKSTYGTAYNICLNMDEDDVGDDPAARAEEISQQFTALYRDAGAQGCLGAFIDRGLAPAT
jgi:hypothetical protein